LKDNVTGFKIRERSSG